MIDRAQDRGGVRGGDCRLPGRGARAVAVWLVAGAAIGGPAWIATGQPIVPPASEPNRPVQPITPGRTPGTVQRPAGTSTPGRQVSPRPNPLPAVTPTPTPTPTATPAGEGAVQPAGEGAKLGSEPPITEGDEVELSAFADAVDLTTLVDYVAKTLNINITVKSGLSGSVIFNAPVRVPKSRLLTLLDALLEQQGYTITYDPEAQFYSVHPSGEVPVQISDAQGSTTRIFATPNVRPSALKSAIDAQMGSASGNPGQPPQVQAGVRQYAYIDELGVIVATDSPRKLAQVESLVQHLLAEYSKSQFIRIELDHVAAPVARERALQLVGQGSTKSGSGQDPNIILQQQQQQQGLGFGAKIGFDNLGDRLTIDPQGNALIFRGMPEEVEQVKAVLAVIDVPSKLTPKKHDVGKAAKQIAEIARQRGLGEVTQIADTRTRNPNDPYNQGGTLSFNIDANGQPGQNKQQPATGGPVMVVDETRGMIIYYGTEDQQAALKALVDELKTDDDRIVFRDYKLKNAKADDVAQIILGVINNQTPTLSSTDTGTDSGGSSGSGGSYNRGSNLLGDLSGSSRRAGGTSYRPRTGSAGSADEGLSIENAEDIFIVSDQAHNQLIVKAPIRDQESLAKLITKLDLRRPQVYIEAKIVVVNWSDDLRLAFETQLINAGGTGGVLNTNFGLSSFGTAGITSPKTVSTGLAGLTSAIIKSDQVPIVMNALQTEVDGRILSSPQVLVDDNTEAVMDSKNQQPTTTTTIGSGGNPNTTTFNDYVDAGTKLRVTPTISDSGYIRLDYEINLSSFTGAGSNGVPPPKQDNTLSAKSVTLPSDTTVVLGGITFDSESKNSKGIPILKDIPLIGLLFQDLNTSKQKTTLYIFLTPKIMRDPNFQDLRLMQEGPQAAVKLPATTPQLTPTYIDVFGARAGQATPESSGSSSAAEPATKTAGR